MNDSIIKLEDCQLDEISGGVTGKQVAKYAIKDLLVLFACRNKT